MIEVYSKLYVGDKIDCKEAVDMGINVLHAAKSCHQSYLGYKKALDIRDPKYHVSMFDEKDLLLNLIDVEFQPPEAMVEAAMGFLSIRHWMKGEPTLIHCDQGVSRAPSLAFLYLYRRMGWKNVETFKMKYPKWNPGEGMVKMLEYYGLAVPKPEEVVW